MSIVIVVSGEGQTFRLGLIKGEEFEDGERITKNIRAEAERRGWLKPPVEVAKLVREQLSDDDILERGLTWVIVMSEPIVEDGNLHLLGAGRRFGSSNQFGTYLGGPDIGRVREHGFLFLLPE